MKKYIPHAFILFAAALAMTACFTPKEEAAFNGTWKLIAIGEQKVDGREVMLDIRNMRIFEGENLTGGIFREGNSFFLQETYKLTAYPCFIQEDPDRTLLVIKTPHEDEDFSGNNLVYIKTSK